MSAWAGGVLEVAAEQATGRGVRGVVLAASPLAAAIGAEAMRAGGNAYDAVVAAALTESVVLPSKCGLAGDLVALRLRPHADQPEALVAVGESPARLPASAMAGGLDVVGPRSVGVPGAPAGYDLLAEEATLPLGRLAAPATRLARDGFAWPRINEALASESIDIVRANNDEPNRYFPDREPLRAGSVVRLPGLADLLDEFVARRASLFEGPAGDVVAAYVQARGGLIERDDFARVRAEWEPAAEGATEDRRLWASPVPTHGPTLLAAMQDAGPAPTAAEVWRRVQRGLAARHSLADGGTSMVSAADADGNVVVVVHSNSFPRFGSGLVVPRYDLILNNRPGRGFAPDPAHPNFPAVGRRPATTLHAWAVSDRFGRPVALGGTPGGENQMPWNTQLLSEAISGDVDPGALVVAPRWERTPDGGVVVEEGFGEEVVSDLAGLAGSVRTVPRWGLRSAQQVVCVPEPGAVIVGAVDPRTGGAAIPM